MWCGRGSLTEDLCRKPSQDAPSTPGSHTPGVPATPGPQRQDGRRPKNAAKLQQTTPHRRHQAGQTRPAKHSCTVRTRLCDQGKLPLRHDRDVDDLDATGMSSDGAMAVRIGTSSDKILGTSITCSGSGKGVSRNCARFSNCPTICGAGSSRVGKEGTGSTICCTVRRCARCCGPDRVAILSGRVPPGSSSRHRG